jgi:uncharacterized phage protein gp47/JayE
MGDYGVKQQGFRKKSRAELVADMEITAKNLFGDNINLADNSPLGLFIKVLSYPLALLWQGLEGVYNSAFINTASGQSLDYLGQYIGIERKGASKAKGIAKFTGQAGFEIPQGFLIETEGDSIIQFQTTESGVISPNNSVKVKVKLVDEEQEGNIASNTITKMAQPISGIESVNNPTAIIDGSGEVKFTGKADTTIPLGTILETESEPVIQFITIEEKGIDSRENNVELAIEAVEAGSKGNLGANLITTAVNKYSQLEKVTNPFATEGGADRESDSEFRKRYKKSVANTGAATIDNIRAKLYQIPNVEAVLIRENNTAIDHKLAIHGDNLPAKSIEAVVLGGAREEIAQAILESKAAGIEAYGQLGVQVRDLANNQHLIRFSRPQAVEIYVKISEVEIDDSFAQDGVGKIKDEIIKYIGGKDSSGKSWTGTKFGEKVTYNKIIDAIFNVVGVQDGVIELKKEDGEYQKSNLTIEETEMAITKIENIRVDVIDR